MIPTQAKEWLAAAVGLAPRPILDTLIAPMQARALIAAQKTGVLTRLARGKRSTAELALELKLDEECLGLVLRVLRAMGYVDMRAGCWEMSRMGRRHFGVAAPDPMEAYVAYGPVQWSLIEQLDQVLVSGQGVDFHDHQTVQEWEDYQRAMLENARAFAWFLARQVPVPRGARRCLDLAGAHGYVGAALCRAHPGLRSFVLDRPEALPHASELARQHGHHDVVEFVAHDLRSDALGESADVTLLCNILHHFSVAQNHDILARVRDNLVRGGTVAVFDIEAPPEHAPAEAAGDALALYFRISSTSQCFRGEDYVSWLRQAGFRDVRAVRSVRLPSRVLVLGRA